MVRVIDEDRSELDGYLYDTSMFTQIELPEVAAGIKDRAGFHGESVAELKEASHI